jgi:ferritin-like metal-binding protein YciE
LNAGKGFFVCASVESQFEIPTSREEGIMGAKSWFSKMTGRSMTLDNLEDLLVEQMEDLYNAEQQLINALPEMVEAAHSEALQRAISSHLGETKGQKTRLEEAFRELGRDLQGHRCEAMAGLIEEGKELMGMDGDPHVKDAALIAAAQRVEHYEIAGYGCARTFARQLGRQQVARLLQDTLEEEKRADKKLTEIAETLVNPQAAHV